MTYVNSSDIPSRSNYPTIEIVMPAEGNASRQRMHDATWTQ